VSTNHYFSESANSDLDLNEIEVTLVGEKHKVYTASGIFSPEHIDQGTLVLLKQIEDNKPHGTVLDIGCGWGPIALSLALANPDCKVIAIDVNHKSLRLTKMNAERLGLKNISVMLPDEVPSDLTFDQIWSNPPIRVGKAALHEILNRWIPKLVKVGSARLVVQKNLGSDSLQKWLVSEMPEFDTQRIDSVKGFRILKVSKN
jgi:16S rRNA G1207 methylase RsmC